jgi:hypothetical protein
VQGEIMKKSLLEEYELRNTKKNIAKAQTVLKEINENKAVRMLLEALDPNKVQQIVNDLDQISKLAEPVRTLCPELAAAADAARADAAKELVPGIKQHLKNWLGMSGKLSKIMAFIGALKQGFAQVPNVAKIVKKGGNVDKTKPLVDQLGTNQEQAVKILQNAFVPPGVFSGLKGLLGGGVPYVKNPGKLATELLTLSLDTLSRFSDAMQNMQVPISPEDAKQIATTAKETPAQQQQAGEEGQPGEKPAEQPGQDVTAEIDKTAGSLVDLIKKKYPIISNNPAGAKKIADRYSEYLRKRLSQ